MVENTDTWECRDSEVATSSCVQNSREDELQSLRDSANLHQDQTRAWNGLSPHVPVTTQRRNRFKKHWEGVGQSANKLELVAGSEKLFKQAKLPTSANTSASYPY